MKIILAKDCSALFQSGHTTSGVYTVQPAMYGSDVQVYCDMETSGGGWTVFQRRVDGSQDFYKNWNEYKLGFGDLNVEFWLGNEVLHHMVSAKNNTLRVDLMDFGNITAYEEYENFNIQNETRYYNLTIGSFSGTAGDSLSYHNGRYFNTHDVDPDGGSNYATTYTAGWWYKTSHFACLNHVYYNFAKSAHGAIIWREFHFDIALKETEMKFRPMNHCSLVSCG